MEYRFYVRKTGTNEYQDVSKISNEERLKIAAKLNDTAVRAAGYVPVRGGKTTCTR